MLSKVHAVLTKYTTFVSCSIVLHFGVNIVHVFLRPNVLNITVLYHCEIKTCLSIDFCLISVLTQVLGHPRRADCENSL